MTCFGGIDLGGTKIEARLFDQNFKERDRRRIDTPTETYEEMLNALFEQAKWLDESAIDCSIGLGVPGVINPTSGELFTANLPASGHGLEADISQKFGRRIACINDCRAFALSEATLGAGQGHRSVLGLVIGTGVAGGHVVDGQLLTDLNNQHGEYGHMALPGTAVAKHDLPLLACGCGQTGCFETMIAGPGLAKLAEFKHGEIKQPQDIIADPELGYVFEVWVDLVGDMIGLITRAIDPNVIVLGGGLGVIDGLTERLNEVLPAKMLSNTEPPKLVRAEGGDASGARGAALYAKLVKEADHA